ncbi:MAG: glutathione peroxidase [Nitrospirota bacterium]|jgi:glutathione peroxidase
MTYATLFISTLISLLTVGKAGADAPCSPLLDVSMRPLAAAEPVHLCEAYRGKVVLIVNTASRCGYTPQYEGLQALYEAKRDQGLVILAFPSNDFGGQEPGSAEEIRKFCRINYGVTFPVFEKIRVARDGADPLYQRLAETAGEYPAWNFHKYLLDRQGRLVASFPSRVRPDDPRLVKAVDAAL